MLIPLIVACALFMENLDSTVHRHRAAGDRALARREPAPAEPRDHLPTCSASPSSSRSAAGWRTGSARAPCSGGAIVVFTLGSILLRPRQLAAGASCCARILQGMGGAMMVPVGRLVLLRSVAKAELVRAMAWLTMPALIGPGDRPAGRRLHHHLFLLALDLLDQRADRRARHRAGRRSSSRTCARSDLAPFDIAGLRRSPPSASSACVRLRDHRPRHRARLGDGGPAGRRRASRRALRPPRPADAAPDDRPAAAAHPDLPRRASLGGFLFRIGIGAVPFLLPLMLQLGFGLSPFNSGLLTFAAAAGRDADEARPPADPAPLRLPADADRQRARQRRLPRRHAGCSGPTRRTLVILAVLLAGGFFRSLQFTSINTLAYAELPPAAR